MVASSHLTLLRGTVWVSFGLKVPREFNLLRHKILCGIKVPLTALRQVYQAMVIPQIVYGCSVWYTPQGGKGYTDKKRTTLSRIQSEAARTIAGTYRATSAAALDVELFILPMHHQLEK